MDNQTKLVLTLRDIAKELNHMNNLLEQIGRVISKNEKGDNKDE